MKPGSWDFPNTTFCLTLLWNENMSGLVGTVLLPPQKWHFSPLALSHLKVYFSSKLLVNFNFSTFYHYLHISVITQPANWDILCSFLLLEPHAFFLTWMLTSVLDLPTSFNLSFFHNNAVDSSFQPVSYTQSDYLWDFGFTTNCHWPG